MQEKLIITIPEPCHEDWNRMTPVEQGRYCKNCQKNVVDFSVKNDEEILEYFKNFSGDVCGNFNNEQVNRPITKMQFKRATSFLKYAASLLLPAALFTSKTYGQKGSVAAVKGDTIPSLKALPGNSLKVNSCTLNENRIVLGGAISYNTFKKSNYVYFTGRVIDVVDGTPLPSVTITCNGKTVTTNTEGYFVIQSEKKNYPAELTLSYVGYENISLDISAKTKRNAITDLKDIAMTRLIKQLDEVLVTSNFSTRLRGRAGGIYVTYEKPTFWSKLKDSVTSSSFKLFPNPVSSSGTVQLSFKSAPPGNYQIRILNSSGQLFYSFQKQITGKGGVEQIHLNEKMLPGFYIVQIINEKKELIQSSKLVVQ